MEKGEISKYTYQDRRANCSTEEKEKIEENALENCLDTISAVPAVSYHVPLLLNLSFKVFLMVFTPTHLGIVTFGLDSKSIKI